MKSSIRISLGVRICVCVALLLSLASNLTAQRGFEFGYVVNNAGDSTQVLIIKPKGDKTPQEVQFYHARTGTIVTLPVTEVQSFGVPNKYRFERHRVDIDQSSQQRRNLSDHPFPEWQRDVLFLKVIVEGPGSLYQLNDGVSEQYFYTREDSPVEQLEFKNYIDRQNHVASYRRFEQQLLEDVACSGSHLLNVNKLRFSRYPLENYFRRFNECVDRPFRVYYDKPDQVFFAKLTAGLVIADMRMFYEADEFHYGLTASLSLGLELEGKLPMAEKVFSILAEPRFQSFSAELREDETSAINYNFLEVPVGLRYYFETKRRIRPFIDAHYIPRISLDFAKSSFAGQSLTPGDSFSYGGGVNWGWFSTAVRCYTSRDVVTEYSNMASTFQRVEVIVGVSIF